MNTQAPPRNGLCDCIFFLFWLLRGLEQLQNDANRPLQVSGSGASKAVTWVAVLPGFVVSGRNSQMHLGVKCAAAVGIQTAEQLVQMLDDGTLPSEAHTLPADTVSFPSGVPVPRKHTAVLVNAILSEVPTSKCSTLQFAKSEPC